MHAEQWLSESEWLGMGASREGKFWLGLILTLSLSYIFAISTENEKFLVKEMEIAFKSTEKSAGLLFGKIDQNWPQLSVWIPPKEKWIKFLSPTKDCQESSHEALEDPKVIFANIQEEKWKIDEMLGRAAQDWANPKRAQTPSAAVPFSFLNSLNGVLGYAELIQSSVLMASFREALGQLSEKEEAEIKKRRQMSYKKIIIAWFEDRFKRQSRTMEYAFKMFSERIQFLKAALKLKNCNDLPLKKSIRAKIKHLERTIEKLGKIISENGRFLDEAIASFPVENAASEKSNQSPTQQGTEEHNEFFRIVKEIEDLEFKI